MQENRDSRLLLQLAHGALCFWIAPTDGTMASVQTIVVCWIKCFFGRPEVRPHSEWCSNSHDEYINVWVSSLSCSSPSLSFPFSTLFHPEVFPSHSFRIIFSPSFTMRAAAFVIGLAAFIEANPLPQSIDYAAVKAAGPPPTASVPMGVGAVPSYRRSLQSVPFTRILHLY
jgi:hypothetical protein